MDVVALGFDTVDILLSLSYFCHLILFVSRNNC